MPIFFCEILQFFCEMLQFFPVFYPYSQKNSKCQSLFQRVKIFGKVKKSSKVQLQGFDASHFVAGHKRRGGIDGQIVLWCQFLDYTKYFHGLK